MAQLRPKIVKLAKIIGGVTGITTRIDENAPEYYCMAGILTDEEADVAIAAGLRKERTAAYLARKVGKTVQEVQPLLDNLVYYGIFRRSHNETLGEDTYYMQIFAPGILEMMAARHASGGRPRVRGIHPQPRSEHGRHDPRRLRPHARHPGRERARGHSRRERI